MPTTLYTVDAFTDQAFAGNPAAVCILDAPRDEVWMKHVAREMNLSETAFVHPIEGGWSLRWFTPTVEVKLCGHATLASAFTLWATGVLQSDTEAKFHTLSGWLLCQHEGDWIAMDFPARPPESCESLHGLDAALGCDLVSTSCNDMDYLVEVGSENVLRTLKPNLSALSKLPVRGIIVTCSGVAGEFDFLSRFFAPAAGVNEDPVTGSAHCALGPYWKSRLGKDDFIAFQASERGGVVKVSVRDDRVILRGQAVMMSRLELLH